MVKIQKSRAKQSTCSFPQRCRHSTIPMEECTFIVFLKRTSHWIFLLPIPTKTLTTTTLPRATKSIILEELYWSKSDTLSATDPSTGKMGSHTQNTHQYDPLHVLPFYHSHCHWQEISYYFQSCHKSGRSNWFKKLKSTACTEYTTTPELSKFLPVYL